MTDPKTGMCAHCGRSFRLRKDGTTFHHKGPNGQWLCPGAGVDPLTPEGAARLAALRGGVRP